MEFFEFENPTHKISEQSNVLSLHPTSCSTKKLFYSGYFAGKIDPVLYVTF